MTGRQAIPEAMSIFPYRDILLTIISYKLYSSFWENSLEIIRTFFKHVLQQPNVQPRAGRLRLILLCFPYRKRSERRLIRLMKPSNSNGVKSVIESLLSLLFSLLPLFTALCLPHPLYLFTFFLFFLLTLSLSTALPPSVRWLSLK